MAASSEITMLFIAAGLLLTVVCAADLPIFFFHGVFGSANTSQYMNDNMTAEGRVFNALDFCTGRCTLQPLSTQVSLAVAQVRSIIAKDSNTYTNGYIFIGHAQGATIARAVIECMDDHNVAMFMSLAGIHNGLFYGPQDYDAIPLQNLLKTLGPAMIPSSTFDFLTYSDGDTRGHLQANMYNSIASDATLNSNYAFANLLNAPGCAAWISTNPFLPVSNNINMCTTANCTAAQAQRKANFVKVHDALFFASPQDGTVAPYQSSLLGKYASLSDVPDCSLDRFENMTVLPMTETYEYLHDTYGLQTMDKRGGVHLFPIANVTHQCWVQDATIDDKVCRFSKLYDMTLYRVLKNGICGRHACEG